eukprot:542890-Pelagomonas_calceolata.AAC.1
MCTICHFILSAETDFNPFRPRSFLATFHSLADKEICESSVPNQPGCQAVGPSQAPEVPRYWASNFLEIPFHAQHKRVPSGLDPSTYFP